MGNIIEKEEHNIIKQYYGIAAEYVSNANKIKRQQLKLNKENKRYSSVDVNRLKTTRCKDAI